MTLLRAIPAILVLVPGLQAQESEIDKRIRTIGGLDVQLTKDFLNEIKRAIAQGDKRAVSKMVSYPTTVDLKSGPKKKIHNRVEFEAHYDEIINERVSKAVQAQAYEDLFVNWRGVMVGNGEIWFAARKGLTGKYDQFRIIKVNN
jgi:hypothetical protein